ncbi:MAG TPA: DUF3035 domain-containing protein [Acetobacteraceae bacterium]|nr:DUF3035 domain-containing protein [Acetobacteraceae bacterium]
MQISRLGRLLRGAVLLAGAAALLGGCQSSNIARTFGLTRDAPDEFTVTTRAPLSMPPDFNLRPPRPGASRPQEQSERTQAEEALVPQMALGTQPAGESPGQQALMQQAGPEAPSDIRNRVDHDAQSAEADKGFVNNLLTWQSTDTEQVLVDPTKEAQRLKHNAALGQSPATGETPMIQQQKKTWFQNLFSWM